MYLLISIPILGYRSSVMRLTLSKNHTAIATPLQNQEVQAKASSAARWCKHASDYAAAIGTKTRKYLLVPHDEITESKRLNDFLRFEVKY